MKLIRTVALVFTLAWLFGLTQAAQAQNPVSWSVKSNAARALKPGDKFTVQLVAQIDSDWYIYSLTQGEGGPKPTSVTVPDGQPFKLVGAVRSPKPYVKMDANFGINTETHAGSVTFTVPLVVTANAQPGAQNVQLTVRYQACNETICLPPRPVKLTVPVELVAAPAAAATATPAETLKDTPAPPTTTTGNSNANPLNPNPAPPMTTEAPKPKATSVPAPADTTGVAAATQNVVPVGAVSGSDSLWSFIWLAMTVGALSLLTPCVFPMVPITVSYFTNHAAGHRSAAVRDALIYAVGIILTFTGVGVALALVFGAAGINKFAASPWVNLAITAIFISFALSLFGAFNLQVPPALLTKLDAISRKGEGSGGLGRIIALLLMGLTFSLTSFTCTAPFVGTLLVMAAQGDWIYPVIGMLAFSTVFALPFFMLALAPQLVSQLPKSGGWLNAVKVVMGLLEVAAAMKFLSNVDMVWHWGIFTREVVLASWVAVALLIALYLLGKFQLMHDVPTERIGAGRLMTALGSLSLGFYLFTGLFGAQLGELESFLPPPTEGGTVARGVAASGESNWMTNDYEGALARARKENKLVFIDFTGYTCTNCRWMETNMFKKESVRRELDKYVLVRLYTDGEGEIYERQQKMQEEKFGTVALPYYAVVNADGQPVKSFPGLTRDASEFLSFLQNGGGPAQTASVESLSPVR